MSDSRTRVIRKDRFYQLPLGDDISPDVKNAVLNFLNSHRSDLERMMRYPLDEHDPRDEFRSYIRLHGISYTNEESIWNDAHAFLASDEYRAVRDPVDSMRKKTCLPGQYIFNANRESDDLDRYLVVQEEIMVGWSIAAHLYDRLLSDTLYKLSRPRFFTSSYKGREAFQAISGCIVGPICSGLMMTGLASQTLLGPLFVIGFCCLPSVNYLVKSVKCVIDAIDVAWNGTCPNQDSLHIKIHLQHALSCLMIALLMPLAWGICFPLELVRFITRTTATVIDAVTSCCSSIEPEFQPRITAGI